MKINRTARKILSITAFAWSIPFAQAGDVLNRETENEPERASAVRVRRDAVITARILAALLVQPEAKSLDVSVETIDGEVKLTGFVSDEAQRRKALKIVSAVTGVATIRDKLASAKPSRKKGWRKVAGTNRYTWLVVCVCAIIAYALA